MSRAILVLACSTSLMGCILTRDLDYEPPANLPASVHGSAESPMDAVLVIDKGETPVGADAGIGGAAEQRFVALVRDPNVDDELEGLVFVNRDPDTPGTGFVQELDIPANGNLQREQEFFIQNSTFNAGCNLVEFHVSRQFSNFPELSPIDQSGELPDLGIGAWWVAATDTGTPTVDMGSCPRRSQP